MSLTVVIAVAVLATAAWAALFGLVLLITRSSFPEPAPATMDLGPEPPAVVNLLANRWYRPDEDAAEATLLDLAGRRYYEIRQASDDPVHSTIHLNPNPPAGPDLLPFEQRLLSRIRAAAVGGVVPLTALTFRDADQAKGWARRFNAEVVAHARRLGVSRRRISKGQISLLSVAATVPGVAIALAVAMGIERNADADDKGGGYASMVATIPIFISIFAYIAGRYRGERSTPEGRAAAARWLGVRGWLAGHDAFADLPPAAVMVWDRYLGYGAALHAAHAATAALDLGMGSKYLVWSSYGGSWRRVKVRYPRFFDRYGRQTSALVKGGVWRLVLGFGLALISRTLPDAVPDKVGSLDSSWAGNDISMFTSPTRLVTALLATLLIVSGLYRIVRATVDHHTPVEITGEVLWISVWKSASQGEDSPSIPWLHHLAVDDGTTDRTVAWGLPSEWSSRSSPGDLVQISVRRWTRRVVAIKVLREGGGHSLHRGFDTDDNTENLVAEALGERKNAPISLRTAVASTVLTAEEVARAVGEPVRVRELGPINGLYETTAAGKPVAMIQMQRGPMAKLWWAAAKRGTPLPGLGDEAYLSETGAAVRKGDAVVILVLHRGGRAAAPHLPWLMGQVATRL
ncbi:putative membrane protein DUF2207 [Asanoa ferruginea]|uniref:Putative membrane protein DUF2207 n=1 Tax=Asanoa ferruginea TaxID=53367 RepID=A0A3E0A5Z7_9ACTN|nr:DUF2207 domain-containing protein [Asanoa ferruginea]REG01871.1 putative membrane protein DUF2207 [Asanoa ferruginea]GIF50252.1 hypothetical protein Afe04nite_47910 [Asanoa ferruginea]